MIFYVTYVNYLRYVKVEITSYSPCKLTQISHWQHIEQYSAKNGQEKVSHYVSQHHIASHQLLNEW